jgi:hypothetical protein
MSNLTLTAAFLMFLAFACGTDYYIEDTDIHIDYEVEEVSKDELKKRNKILRKKLKKCRRKLNED